MPMAMAMAMATKTPKTCQDQAERSGDPERETMATVTDTELQHTATRGSRYQDMLGEDACQDAH